MFIKTNRILIIFSHTCINSYVQDKDRGSHKDGRRSSLVLIEGSEETQLTCCADCSANFETEAQSSRNTSSHGESTSSTLPSWLKDENKRRQNGSDDQVNKFFVKTSTNIYVYVF